MINMQAYTSADRNFREAVRCALEIAYERDDYAEQRDVPFEYALEEVLDELDSSLLIVATDGVGGVFVAGVVYNQTSHHVQGNGAILHIMLGNGLNPNLCRKVLNFIKHGAVATKHSWVQTQRRVAPYTYRAKYFVLRSKHERLQESN